MCISNVILVSHRVLITPLDALPLVYIMQNHRCPLGQLAYPVYCPAPDLT